ncbi:hypothetical protein CCR78_10875 [Rhodovulum imhoffii]|nr:hypothetical protein [Rhodovulum imhoffii]
MAPAVLGEGYVSGAALAIAGVFGRRAGRAAADAGATGVAPRLPRPAFPASPPPAGDPLEEAARVLNICNTCGFCSGLCDVFPAAQLREGLARGDIRHLAHLCHDCRSCFYDCQYVPPHDFAVNVPQTLSAVRMVEYGGGASMPWRVFLACTLGLPLLVLGLIPAEVLFSAHQGPGAFYRVIPHGVMSGLAGLALGGAAAGLTWRVWRFWRAGRGPQVRLGPRAILWALWDVASLRNLGDCETRHGTTGRARRWAHHALAYGFGLTFLATLWAGGLHAAGQSAPYPMFSPPVLLGALGGAGMLAGVVGLGWLRGRADRAPAAPAQEAADRGARRALGTVAASGLALLTFRDTAAMGLLLALHLGSVLGLGLGVPFGKLSHGGYRAVALLRNRAERAHRQP